MAFTVPEKMLLAAIVQEDYEVVSAQITARDFDSDQEAYIRDRMDVFEGIQDSHVIYTGEGVNFNNARKREAIRQELRKALGLSLVSYEVSGPGSLVIEHLAVW